MSLFDEIRFAETWLSTGTGVFRVGVFFKLRGTIEVVAVLQEAPRPILRLQLIRISSARSSILTSDGLSEKNRSE